MSVANDQLGITLRHPEGWFGTWQGDRGWIVNAPPEQATGAAVGGLAQVFVTVEHRTDHADAVRRLREIASEFEAPVMYLTIGGWPAMQRQVITAKEQPGAVGADAQQQQILTITTAIAAGDLLIRADARMAPDVGEETKQQVLAIESSIGIKTAGDNAQSQRDIEELQAVPKLAPFVPPPSTVRPAGPLQQHGMLEEPRRLLQGALARSEDEDRPGGSESEPEPDKSRRRCARHQWRFRERAGHRGFDRRAEYRRRAAVPVRNVQRRRTDLPDHWLLPVLDRRRHLARLWPERRFYEGTIDNASSALNVSTDGGKTFTFRPTRLLARRPAPISARSRSPIRNISPPTASMPARAAVTRFILRGAGEAT